MYMDKRLKQHTLLQAVTRCNRPYVNKNYGLVVDYAGFGKELAQAVVMFSAEDLEGFFHVDDVERELELLKQHHKQAMAYFSGIPLDGASPKVTLQRCVDALDDEKKRGEFDAAFRAFSKSMDFLMPDLRVDPYLKDFKFLGSIRKGAMTQYRDQRLSSEVLGPKIESLIHAHIAAEGVEEVLAPLIITAPDFQEKLNAKGSGKAKAAHFEYAIRDTIQARVAEDPAFYESLKEQLEAVIEQHRQGRVNEADLLKNLFAIKDKEARKETMAKSLGLENATQFAFYNLLDELKIQGEKDHVSLVKEIIKTIEERSVVEWEEREDIQREMRREIKRLLRRNGCKEEEIPHFTTELMELAQRTLGR